MQPPYTQVGLHIDPHRRAFTYTRFFEVCAQYPSHTALIFLGTRFPYGALRTAIERFAAALYQLGVKPQDRVMLYLANTPQWIMANFAIQRLGAVVVPVSPIYTAHEIQYIVEDAGVRTIICQDTNFGYVQEVARHTSLKHIIVTTLTELLPPWKRALGYLLDKIPRGRIARGPHIHHFRTLLKQSAAALPEVQIDPWRDLAYIMYTGGTTGFPKGVPGNHMTEVAYIEDIMHDILLPHIRLGKDRLLMVAPLYHIMAKGFLTAVGLNFANTTILMPLPHIDALLKAIERYRVRWLLGVPTLYRMVLENDRLAQYRLQSLRYCYSGGDVLPGEVFKRWRQLTGVPIYQVYGSTEVGHVAYSRLDSEPHPQVIGAPLKSYRCLVVDPDTLTPVVAGEVGELLVSADWTLKSYWNKPAESARAYVQIGEEIYYRTGDFVTLNAQGELQFVERTADIIKYKGYRISASEIEAVLQDNPVVIGACVVGLRDTAVGERIKALVVLKSDVKGVTGSELRQWCKERLAPYKVPHYIEFRDMLPKSKVGKLLRREIRNEQR